MALTEQQARTAERVMKHTPGPWAVKIDKGLDKSGHSIDIVTEKWITGGNRNYGACWICDVHQQFSGYKVGMANATLIASAPTMLAALLDLQGMELHITDPGLRAKFVDRVYSAIEKALK